MGPFTRRNGRRLVAVTALAAAVAAVPTAVASPWEHSVRAGSLAHSLGHVIGGLPIRPTCSAGKPRHWVCEVPDPASRTLIQYRVRATDRCWVARREDGPGGARLPRSIRGCVGMWDQLRLADRL
jgi:hypothetical protein